MYYLDRLDLSWLIPPADLKHVTQVLVTLQLSYNLKHSI